MDARDFDFQSGSTGMSPSGTFVTDWILGAARGFR